MNKMNNVFFTIVLCLLFHSLVAEEHSKIEVRPEAFIPTSKLFREIYGDVLPAFAIENSTKINSYCEIWIDVDWLSHHGHSTLLENPTEIKIANIGVGPKFIYSITQQLVGYVGVGISPGFLWLKNSSFCTGKRVYRKMLIGGVGKCGVYYFFPHTLYLDLFVDYLYEPVFKHWVNIGGFKAGGGLGFIF